ncbi:type I polyketide synthase [Brucella gallinifaecis]|uniref:type I polyketide synthase n=1 Tax=Brucella gallinifaecis TaxID=215590 RepID=UPI0023608959|nr:type I polyketide synthase [Brucella gallinifaecis]
MNVHSGSIEDMHEDISIIGVSGRFPGAPDIDTFWKNQLDMRCGAVRLTHEEMAANGRTEAELDRKDLVGLSATVDASSFDAPFFQTTAAEAELMDPQMRLLLETAWHTLENGGCVPEDMRGRIGVFAAANLSTYWLHNLAGRYREADPNELLHIVSTNSQDYLATTIAYRLGLTGPALTIQTACSSGLVLSAVACQHLIDGSCDAALVLAASLTFPQGGGYFSTAESIFSPDGICRPFDAGANGTFASDGVCALLLKRTANAIEAGDRILARIKGWAINNDGRRKMGFSAPSADGQRDVLIEAMAAANIEPGDLDYIETHGTGTRLGDPIEFEAIRDVHGHAIQPGKQLALSSAKSSIGHLGPAAGLAGLVRATLAVHNRTMPGTLNFSRLNPVIAVADTQIYVLGQTAPFPLSSRPPRAGVSSFGIGGTNAHLIIEGVNSHESEEADIAETGLPETIGLSAIDADGIERARQSLRQWLESDRIPATERRRASLSEIADTSLFSRQPFAYRSAVSGRSREEIIDALKLPLEKKSIRPVFNTPAVCFVFTGGGVFASNHARVLAENFPAFAEALNEIEQLQRQRGKPSIGEWLFRPKVAEDERDMVRSHLAAFAFGYANARLWQSLGVKPGMTLGHSLGEVTAACVAGGISLDSALAFVETRAGIIERCSVPGELLAIALGQEALAPYLTAYPDIEIAGHNGTGQSLVAGERPSIDRLAEQLRSDDVLVSMLPVGRPVHTSRMRAACDPAHAACAGLFHPPAIGVASTVTGKLEFAGIADPQHWARQMVTAVNFTGAIQTAALGGTTLFLELGPRATFVTAGAQTLRALGHEADWRASFNLKTSPTDDTILNATAETRAWLFERGIVTSAPHRPRAAMTTLPSYPFARLRFWRDEHRHSASEPAVRTLSEFNAPSLAEHQDEDGADMLRSILAEIWQVELGQKYIGAKDSFVGLGGSSLVALKVVGTIERRIGVRPPLISLTNASSFEQFVGEVTQMLIGEIDDEASTAHTNQPETVK